MLAAGPQIRAVPGKGLGKLMLLRQPQMSGLGTRVTGTQRRPAFRHCSLTVIQIRAIFS